MSGGLLALWIAAAIGWSGAIFFFGVAADQEKELRRVRRSLAILLKLYHLPPPQQ